MSTHKPRTLRQHFILPILSIVLVQAILYAFVFIRLNVTSKMDANAYDIFAKHTITREADLESQMIHDWTNLDQSRTLILRSLHESLSAQSATPRDMKNDAALAQQVVAAAADEVISLLRTNGVTGAFLVLDAPGLASDTAGTTRAGFYVRDLDPTTYTEDNSDLLLERAMPTVTKSLRLPLDSNWSSVFEFSGDGRLSAENFFFRPLRAAQSRPTTSPTDLGYWSPLFSLPDNQCNVISYSQPLILPDGTVLGVIGIDITEQYLLSRLDHTELGLGQNATYLLGTLNRQTFTPMLASGTYYPTPKTPLVLSATDHPDICEPATCDARGNVMAACLSPIRLYNPSSPFADQHWALAAVASQPHLLSFSQDMRLSIYFSLLLSLLCGIIALMVLGHIITKPITLLAHDLAKSDPSQPVTLPKLNIDEIDRLSGVIETLSVSVAAAASKYSEIIRMTGLPVGVFEYSSGSHTVFCSRTLCSLLGWEESTVHTDLALPLDTFRSRLDALEPFRCTDEEGRFYRLQLSPTQVRWIRLVSIDRADGFVGSVADVTHEMLEKQKMQYERDYDVLSQLYNRRAFERCVKTLFRRPQELHCAALVMWDLDNLKFLNDTYGHDCGDQYITAFSALLSDTPSSNYITARRSGDEFYAFFYDYASESALRSDINAQCERIKASSLQLPTGVSYQMRASGGIAYYPKDADNYEDLVHYADFAMYNVKHRDKGNLEEFDRAQYQQNSLLLRGQDALDRLLDQSLVRFALQPILDVRSCSIFGYELLMRPQMQELSSVTDVLRLARSNSKLRQIEQLTLFKGMETFTRLDNEGKIPPDARVFINSVASQTLPPEDELRFFALYDSYLPRFVLEITENDPYDTEGTQHKIAIIRDHGGDIALDDYGAGFNGEAILLFVAPGYIKIDASIIRNIHKDPNRQSVLDYLVCSAKPRGIRVLAEGVETIEEVQYVVSHGVDLLQGYYVAMPTFDPEPIAPQVLSVVREASRGLPPCNPT